jgi:hypothetical protein
MGKGLCYADASTGGRSSESEQAREVEEMVSRALEIAVEVEALPHTGSDDELDALLKVSESWALKYS